MNISQSVPSSIHRSAFFAATHTDRRPLPTVRALDFDAPLAPTMADLAHAASSQASYYDVPPHSFSLSLSFFSFHLLTVVSHSHHHR